MSGAVDDPFLHQRVPVGIEVQGSRVGMAVWDLSGLGSCVQRRPLHCLRNDRVSVSGVDGGIPFAVKNDCGYERLFAGPSVALAAALHDGEGGLHVSGCSARQA
jgi:hypothetical protein